MFAIATVHVQANTFWQCARNATHWSRNTLCYLNLRYVTEVILRLNTDDTG